MFTATALCMCVDFALSQVFSPPPCLSHHNHITLKPEICKERWGFFTFYQKIGGCAFHLRGISYLYYYELLNWGSVHGCSQLWLPAASDSFMINWVRCLILSPSVWAFFVSIKLYYALKLFIYLAKITRTQSLRCYPKYPPAASPFPLTAFLPFFSSLLDSENDLNSYHLPGACNDLANSLLQAL